MAKTIQTKIESKEAFNNAIDQYGDAKAAIDASTAESKVLKAMIEVYANEHGIKSLNTAKYRFRMKRAEPALKRSSDVSEASVIALLKKNAATRDFVTETYNAAAIKSHFGNQDEAAEALAKFGLYLANNPPHAEVSSIKK